MFLPLIQLSIREYCWRIMFHDCEQDELFKEKCPDSGCREKRFLLTAAGRDPVDKADRPTSLPR